jgi:5-methyltetrahydrofolate--homocysteine methyltransferase
MKSIIEELKNNKILVSDGAWGTLLQKKGLQPGECPELWNINHPESVLEIARSYIDAGADMIETNSFGGNAFKLQHYGLESRVFEINKAAAEISRKGAGSKIVLGSIGPTGKMLVMGDVTEEELYNAFKEQAKGLEAGGADALIVETMSDIDEARIAIKACLENTRCEVICTFTFEKTDEKVYHTMMGVSPTQMVEELSKTGVAVLGANCGNGISDMIGIIEEMRIINSSIPLLVHANAGAPVYKDGQTIFPESPEHMAHIVGKLAQAGANIIGGCCGTTPEHIRQIAAALRK